VKAEHLRAVLWLHWRLRVNQLKRAGTVNAIILAILAVGAFVIAAVGLVAAFLVGLLGLAHASVTMLLYVWDGVVLTFLFCRALGLLSDLQRSEPLSLEKFLHLPVSLASVFVLNYLSSFVSFTLLIFVPPMIGLSLGLVFAKGPIFLLLLPLLAAFLLMVTALTHQFQGWLASLMVNKRRRRTIIVVATAAFILLTQLPNLFNFLGPGRQVIEPIRNFAKEQAELDRGLSSGSITPAQHQERQEQLTRALHSRMEGMERQTQEIHHTVWLINLFLPPGWLPLGVATAAEGEILPALLGTMGLALIGTASLWRSYRTTVRLYTGQFSSGKKRATPAAPPAKGGKPSTDLLEREIPWLSRQAAAIALASFRSLTRAPEAKMMLLTPIILVIIFGGLLFRHGTDMPEGARPLLAFGAMAIILFSMVQMAGNQFGFDRNGFRVFVLCGVRRSDILLGKNLAVAPLALALGLILASLLQIVHPMRLDYFLAVLPQFLSMYLLFCLLANALSILAPLRISAGSFKPTNMKGIPILLHLAFVLLFPLALAPTLFPLGAQLLWEQLHWIDALPVGLLLSLVEGAAIGYVYRLLLTRQGYWLQAREQRILEIVTTKAE
jgi:hypothetical protein